MANLSVRLENAQSLCLSLTIRLPWQRSHMAMLPLPNHKLMTVFQDGKTDRRFRYHLVHGFHDSNRGNEYQCDTVSFQWVPSSLLYWLYVDHNTLPAFTYMCGNLCKFVHDMLCQIILLEWVCYQPEQTAKTKKAPGIGPVTAFVRSDTQRSLHIICTCTASRAHRHNVHMIVFCLFKQNTQPNALGWVWVLHHSCRQAIPCLLWLMIWLDTFTQCT